MDLGVTESNLSKHSVYISLHVCTVLKGSSNTLQNFTNVSFSLIFIFCLPK